MIWVSVAHCTHIAVWCTFYLQQSLNTLCKNNLVAKTVTGFYQQYTALECISRWREPEIIMAALWNRTGHYIFALWFLSFFFFFYLFSSPNLSGRTMDVYHTSTHDVVIVRIWNAGLKCAVCGSLEMQNPKTRQKSPSGHHHTTLSGQIFATKARIDNRK